jgi:conjugative relaxase-like TrwC/TraI family protein
MMSAAAGSTAGAAESYYYNRDQTIQEEGGNGQWFGKGAEALGLSGQIQKDDFLAILRGQDPLTKEQLVQIKNGTSVEDRRAGNDYTFSAPKSVSVAFAACTEGIKEAHDAAVQAVAGYMQERYSLVRNPGGAENTGNLVAAKFDHSTSRALDPQLHSHLYVANMTQDSEGNWRANEPRNIYVDQKALGEIYRQALAHELQQQGHQLNWIDRGNLQFELASVDKNVTAAFSQRREAIEKQVSEWKSAGEHKNVSEPRLYEMAALGTRESKNQDVTKEEVQQLWKEGAEKAGTSLEAIKAGVEAGKSPEKKPESLTAEKAVIEAARILTDKEAVIDRAQLMQTAGRISGGQHDIKSLSEAIDKNVVSLGQDAKGREFHTTAEIREIEHKNLETLKSLQGFKSVTSQEEVKAFVEKWEQKAGFQLSEGQKTMVLNELTGTKGFAAVQGDPGTGKTTASKVVESFNKEVLQASGREHYTLNVAFTGKASSEMSAAAGKPAWTIDSFLNAYNSGKIQVAPAAQVQAANAAAMKDETGKLNAGDQHAQKIAEATPAAPGPRFTTEAERNGGGLIQKGPAGTKAQTFVNREGGTTERYSMSRYGWTNTTGVVTRTDGSKATWEQASWTKGGITESWRTEKLSDGSGSKHTTSTTAFNGAVRGVTTTALADGSITRTFWAGSTITGKLEITKSETSKAYNPEQAAKLIANPSQAMGVAFTTPKEQPGQELQAAEKSVVQQVEQQTVKSSKPEILIPAGAQVVLKVDEASFVGAKQAENLLSVVNDLQKQGIKTKLELIGDTKQMQSISAGDMFRQAQELAKGGKGDFSALTEINRQKEESLLKVAQTLNKDGNSRQLAENAKTAFSGLQQQGRVTEISSRSELVKATVDRYLSESDKLSNKEVLADRGEKQSVLLVTILNKDRVELNQAIREARIEAGQIEQGQTYKTLTQANQGPTTASYTPGQQLQFTGERARDGQQRAALGVPLQAVGTVQSVNAEANTVRVLYEYERGGETHRTTKEFNASELVGRTQLYTEAERNFSQGDKIVFLKNDNTLDVKNGHRGEIKEMDDKGNVKVELEGGAGIKEFNLNQYNNVDHGYAVTTEKSQGATVESVIQFAYVKPGVENDRGALQTALKQDVSQEQFKEFNSSVSTAEGSWSKETIVTGHAATVSVGLVKDQDGNISKGVQVEFHNGYEVVKDAEARADMREAGMYFSAETQTWNAAITNGQAAELLGTDHPLQNQEYKDAAKEALGEISKEGKVSQPAQETKTAEVNTEQYGQSSYNTMNVAVTRAEYEAHIMTNSAAGYEREIQNVAEKTTNIGREEQQKEAEQGNQISSPNEQQLAEKMEGMDETQKAIANNEITAAEQSLQTGDREEQALNAVEAGEHGATIDQIEKHETEQQAEELTPAEQLEEAAAGLKNEMEELQEEIETEIALSGEVSPELQQEVESSGLEVSDVAPDAEMSVADDGGMDIGD